MDKEKDTLQEGNVVYFPTCDHNGACGARWCNLCTILNSTNFRGKDCPFQKKDIKNVMRTLVEMKNNGESDSEIMGETGMSAQVYQQCLQLAIDKGYILQEEDAGSKDFKYW